MPARRSPRSSRTMRRFTTTSRSSARGAPLTNRSAPFIAIPTTAGTGAEVTRNAVLMAEGERVKVSLRSALMLPAVALIDPELTYSLPPDVTASTGLDALTQCIEPFVSPNATPLSDAVAREGIRRAAGALRRAFRDGADVDARRDMAVASVCGGLALANAKLGAVHGFAAPLGGMFPIPHGVACARLLPSVAAINVRALRARAPSSAALARYDEVARIVTGNHAAKAEDAVAWLETLVDDLCVPRLYELRSNRRGHRSRGRGGANGKQHAGEPDRVDGRRARGGAPSRDLNTPGLTPARDRPSRHAALAVVELRFLGA